MSHRYVLGRAAMVDWSDRGPARAPVPAEWSAADRAPEPRGPRRPAAGGPAFTGLVERTVTGGHVLLAGCLDDELIDAVAGRADRVTVLVRGTVDAEQIEGRFPGIAIVCGDLTDLGEQTFDSALLLDGLDRISTVESEPDTWAERLAALRHRARTIVLSVPNPLSPASLGRVPDDRAADSDADWAVDRSAPTTSADALAALPASVALAGFGPWARPTLLLPEGCAKAGSGFAALALAHSGTGGAVDERSALRTAADAGRLDAHAPLWVLVPGPSTAPPAGLPNGVLFEEAFLDAAAARDAGRARQLLGAAAAATASLTEPALPHTLVLGANDVCAALPVPVPDTEDRLVAFCAALATRIEQLGVRRPWPVAADRAELTALLLAAAGESAAPEAIAAALGPEPEPAPAAPLREVDRSESIREREAAYVDLIAVLETRAVNAEDRAEKRAEELKVARTRLARAREEVEALRGSRSFRIGRAVTAPLRRLRGGD